MTEIHQLLQQIEHDPIFCFILGVNFGFTIAWVFADWKKRKKT